MRLLYSPQIKKIKKKTQKNIYINYSFICWRCDCVSTHRDTSLTVSVFVAEVPQVDGQLAQLVVPQVAVSQQDPEQGKGQSALTPRALLQRGARGAMSVT